MRKFLVKATNSVIGSREVEIEAREEMDAIAKFKDHLLETTDADPQYIKGLNCTVKPQSTLSGRG